MRHGHFWIIVCVCVLYAIDQMHGYEIKKLKSDAIDRGYAEVIDGNFRWKK